jgi:hypothetical protein
MLKTAKFWRAFTAATRADAEQAADSWWAEQSGFDRIGGWTLPADGAAPGGGIAWTTTIVYRPSGGGARLLH